MDQWEYKFVEIKQSELTPEEQVEFVNSGGSLSDEYFKQIEKQLNESAKEGWILVKIYDGDRILFKRKK